MKLKTLAILLSLYLEFLLVIQAWKKTNQPVVNKNAKKFLSGCSFYCFFIPNKVGKLLATLEIFEYS